jgi:hypothetical protein
MGEWTVRQIYRSTVSWVQIRAFALENTELHEWAQWFVKSEALLDDPAPAAPYHSDIVPPDASLKRRQIAAAVRPGLGLRRHGSWNDCGLADRAAQREYERVGTDLYSALLFALPTAVNGS